MELGLKEVKPWGFLGDMGQAVHDHAFANGYTVVRDIGGHGVGLEVHEDPWVGYNTKRGTDMVMAIREDIRQGIIDTVPMKRLGRPDEIGDLCAYLASDKAAYITGATININGGLHMC